MGVRSSCDMLARNSLLAWLAASARMHGHFQLAGALADALLEQLLVLADFLLRSGQRLDHAVEAFAQVFDLVAGAADLDGPQLPLPRPK